jgi:di/tricarboxylate transporter
VTLSMVTVVVVLVAAVVLFITEKLPVDLVALLMMITLTLAGVLTPKEAFSGFSDEATITVAGMLILAGGLSRTGAVNGLVGTLARLIKRRFWLGIAALLVTVAGVSTFINNTACVAVFLPIVITLAKNAGVSPSKLLMPLSFAAILGGTCSLIGTAPNLLVNSVAVSHGLAPFSMFEFSQLGAITAFLGIVYMLVIGVRLLPDRRPSADLSESFEVDDFLTEVVLLPGGASVGKSLEHSPLVLDLDLDVLEIRRDGDVTVMPGPKVELKAHDELRVRCNVEKLRTLQSRKGLRLKGSGDRSRHAELVEVVVVPGSTLLGRSLAEVDFRNRFGGTAIAIRHRDELLHEGLGRVELSSGDVLLVEVPSERLDHFKAQRAFLMVSEYGEGWFRKSKAPMAVVIFSSVVILATLGYVPISAGTVAGSLAMVLTGCLRLGDAYRALDLKVVFLLAGSLSLGKAIEKTGTAQVVAQKLVVMLGDLGPVFMLSGIYLITMILTELISNSATAVLVSPLAIATAISLELDPRPFLIAVTFAASASFMTPVGYQTNTMIYGPGQYKFIDFIRVGTPLNLLCWLLATVLIPIIWPLR